jgi:pyrroline-5-carboxylate reductase
MKNITIAFIGGGNMARSLIGGLLANGLPPPQVWAADPNPATRSELATHYGGIHTTADNAEAVRRSDVVVIAVKPQAAQEAAASIAAAVQERRPLVISIAAGIRERVLRAWLGEGTAVVRTMPNTPALVGSGATALFANPAVSTEQKDLAESVLRAVGVTLWVEDEGLLDAVTALSGSGPAYFFLMMEALEAAGRRLGLPRDSARLLTLQTALGAAKMALESSEALSELRRRVTSPGGTTERAVQVLEDHHLEAAFDEALQAAHRRSRELADLFGGAR